MSCNTSKITALIVAAGRGIRAGGGDLPKQYRPIGQACALAMSIKTFLEHPRITDVLAVIHPDDRDLYNEAVGSLLSISDPVFGGATRQQSVLNGLEHLSLDPPVSVLIHDAARPFMSPLVIDHVLDQIGDDTGAIPALAITETLKRASSGLIEETVSREGLFSVQTPQGFPFTPLLDAHRKASTEPQALTDDAAVFEAVGGKVYLVEGERINIKLTTEDDFRYAETHILPTMKENQPDMSALKMETRTGQGFDVHAFEPGDHVILGGVRIPHNKGLKGHSDADVGLHALTDAVLGALGQGDIGTHYPPSDPEWKGADSALFLEESARKVTDAGGRIVHLDLTFICEEPKIGPHRDAMIAAITEMTGLAVNRISIKASTSERLGFTGRREGIAALALATIELPVS